jgi:hypothetical protein
MTLGFGDPHKKFNFASHYDPALLEAKTELQIQETSRRQNIDLLYLLTNLVQNMGGILQRV